MSGSASKWFLAKVTATGNIAGDKEDVWSGINSLNDLNRTVVESDHEVRLDLASGFRPGKVEFLVVVRGMNSHSGSITYRIRLFMAEDMRLALLRSFPDKNLSVEVEWHSFALHGDQPTYFEDLCEFPHKERKSA